MRGVTEESACRAWPLSSALRVTLSPLLKQDDSTNPVPTINRHTCPPSSPPVVSCYTTPCSQLTPSDITCLAAAVASSCDRYLPPLPTLSTAKNEYVQLLLPYVISLKPQNRIRLYDYASKTGLVRCDHLANSYFI